MKRIHGSVKIIIIFMVLGFVDLHAQTVPDILWQPFSDALASACTRIVIPSDTVALIGTLDGGLLRSTNEGGTWKRMVRAFDDPHVSGLYQDQTTHEIIAATTDGDVYSTSDYGETWLRLGSANLKAPDVAGQASGLLLAWNVDRGVYAMNNRSNQWRRIYNLPGWAASRTACITTRGVVCVGTSGDGVYASSDTGATWQHAWNVGLRIDEFHETCQGIVFGRMESGLLRSVDGGVTWAKIPGPGTNANAECACISSDAAGVVYIRRGTDLYASRDSGTTWFSPVMSKYPMFTNFSITNRYTFLAWRQSEGLYTGIDSGRSWNRTKTSSAIGAPKAIIETRSGRLITSSSSGAYISADTGMTWETLYIEGVARQYGILRRATNGDLFALPGTPPAIFRSTDEGDSWSMVLKDSAVLGSQSDMFCDSDGLLFITSTGGAFLESVDYGVTWKRMPLPLLEITSIVRARDGALLTASRTSWRPMYRSTDLGVTWDSVYKSAVSPIRFDPRSGALFSNDAGAPKFLLSFDNGLTWKKPPWPTKIPSTIGAFCVDSSRILFAGTNAGRGLLASCDSGRNWVDRTNGIPASLTGPARELYTLSDGRVLLSYDRLYVGVVQTPTPVHSVPVTPEAGVRITDVYPQPAASAVHFTITQRTLQALDVEIVDALGRRIGTIASGLTEPEARTLTWMPRQHDLSAGVYVIRCIADGRVMATRNIIILR